MFFACKIKKRYLNAWLIKKKRLTLHTQFRFGLWRELGYGVMETLQILVLSFQVRILVSQLLQRAIGC